MQMRQLVLDAVGQRHTHAHLSACSGSLRRDSLSTCSQCKLASSCHVHDVHDSKMSTHILFIYELGDDICHVLFATDFFFQPDSTLLDMALYPDGKRLQTRVRPIAARVRNSCSYCCVIPDGLLQTCTQVPQNRLRTHRNCRGLDDRVELCLPRAVADRSVFV